MFEYLMKFPIDIFRKGDFSYGIRLPGLIIFVILVALIAASIWAYRTTIARTNRGFRGFLIFLRSVALCIIAFCLLKPFLMIYQTNPDDSYLLLLVDQSKSMQIADSVDREPRFSRVNQLLFNPEQGLIHKLNEKFKVRLFAFDANAKRIPPIEQTEATGESTNIPASLNEALDDLQGVPLAGAVIFSDGADGSGEDITRLGMRMRDRKLPVHTVGIGSAEEMIDLEVVKIDAPRTAEEDFPVEIWVTVRRKGYRQRTVEVRLKNQNRTVRTLQVELDKNHPTRRVPIKFIPRNPGTQKYEVQIQTEVEEAIQQNNTKKFLLKVAPSRKVKILYVEGHPRQEFAFIKRALKNDPRIQLTDRWLMDDQHYGGTKSTLGHEFGLYPTSKEVLFDFDAIIFGNIAASNFSKQQLENTVEFVRTRGGGFLMLGGSASLGNPRLKDSYINTPIAQILPVELELGSPIAPSRPTQSRNSFSPPPRRNVKPRVKNYKLKLTPEGKSESLMALVDDSRASIARWQNLPPLIGHSKVKRAKAGTTILAQHPTERNEFGNRVLIATHNYNAGRVMVFTPHSSWRWKMFTPTDSENHETHERFWRQVAKWLTTAPKDHLKLDIAKTSYALKEPVIIECRAYDDKFELTNRAKIRAFITDASGKKKELHLEQVLGKDGFYTARFIPSKRSEYKVDVIGTLKSESLGTQHGLFEVEESYEEFVNPELNVQLLQTLAKISGGEYYTVENAAEMVSQISLVESATSQLTEVDIWDMPLIFGTVILLLALEWFLRKRRGLA
ncbi:hypothetical protein IH992_09485 [Candidatus Poribacteria bacterium]|nr:hypothetical protein [Candidatus Poribacteria bacterium]